MTTIPAIEHASQQAYEWVKELTDVLGVPQERSAYAALRSVLHQLRDRMPVNEAIDLGAQLPTLVRGVYYEGWNQQANPQMIHSADEFVGDLMKKLKGHEEIHPESAIRGVFLLLSKHVSKGEIDDVIGTLPDEIKAYWPADRAA